jgi:hypothetical protein
MLESSDHRFSFIPFWSLLMKRGLVLFAVLTAGCSDAQDTVPSAVSDLAPGAAANDGSVAEGTLIALRVPRMV